MSEVLCLGVNDLGNLIETTNNPYDFKSMILKKS